MGDDILARGQVFRPQPHHLVALRHELGRECAGPVSDHQRLARLLPHEGEPLERIEDHVVDHEPRRVRLVLLAGELCKLTDANLVVDALVRSKPTPTLGGLGRKARSRALSGAIAANPRRAGRLKGARVMLVDDVMTSGATSAACVAALKRAGAAKVVIACFARVLDEALPHT